jgi:hypothetical protein
MTHFEQVEKAMRYLAARRLARILSHYWRLDVDLTTCEGATKVMAGLAVQQIAIDTLADRPVYCPDKPTKAESAKVLEWLLVDIPNNLTPEQVDEARRIVYSLSASQAISGDEQSKAA